MWLKRRHSSRAVAIYSVSMSRSFSKMSASSSVLRSLSDHADVVIVLVVVAVAAGGRQRPAGAGDDDDDDDKGRGDGIRCSRKCREQPVCSLGRRQTAVGDMKEKKKKKKRQEKKGEEVVGPVLSST